MKNHTHNTMTGQELKELRLKYNLTQTQVADGIGTDYTRVSEWENGKVKMSNITSKALELFFRDLEKKGN